MVPVAVSLQTSLVIPTFWAVLKVGPGLTFALRQAYYDDGDSDQQRLARRYSYSDRSRYYWPQPAVSPYAHASGAQEVVA